MDLDKSFSISDGERTLHVEPKKVGRAWVYIVHFPDMTPPLILTQATGEKRVQFWTSIPEGRQREADTFGKLVTEHFKALA